MNFDSFFSLKLVAGMVLCSVAGGPRLLGVEF